MTTIYVTESGSSLTVQNQQLKLIYQEELRLSVPINQVSQIILLAKCYLSPEAASLALFRRVPVLFLLNQGQDLVRLKPSKQRSLKYLPQQIERAADEEFTRTTAESLVWARLHNDCILLQELLGNDSNFTVQSAIQMMKLLIDDLSMADSIDELWGYQATSASFYYPALGSLFPLGFGFKKRNRRPPIDPMNCLLNLGYAFLNQTISTFVQASGLHPDYGNLYEDREDSPPLVNDLMNEFRAPIVDELVVNLVKAQVLTLEDFTLPDKQGSVYLFPHALKTFIKYWEEKLHTEVIHPQAGKVSYRQCLEWQVREYIAYLLGDIDYYRPMLKVKVTSLAIPSLDKQETEPLVLVKR